MTRPTARELIVKALRDAYANGADRNALWDVKTATDALLAAVVPETHVVVPREPTREMMKAANAADMKSNIGNYGRDANAEEHWHVMISAGEPK